MIIATTYFDGPIAIAGITDAATIAEVGMYINELEPEFLNNLLGTDLAGKLVQGLTDATPKYVSIRDGGAYTNREGRPARWFGLKRKLGDSDKYISPIADYVYCNYMRTNATLTTGTGEKVVAAANTVQASAQIKIGRAWNRMAVMNWELVDFLLSNVTDYPEFSAYYNQRNNVTLAKMLSRMNILF